jgi:predicted RNA-binding protein with PUA-like domain
LPKGITFVPKKSNMAYWLVKAEPEDITIEQIEAAGTTWWTGVRNYAARNNLRAMEIGDIAIFYRSMVKPAIIGLLTVTKTAIPDTDIKPDEPKGDWSCTELGFLEKFDREISLKELKSIEFLQTMDLFRLSRLSVQVIKPEEMAFILQLAGSKHFKS